jgi:hypothetical protein
MSSAVYNDFLKAFPNADANIQVANINTFLKNKEIETYTPLSLNDVIENVKTSNMITVTKNFDILLSIVGYVSEDSLIQIGDLLYIGGKFSVGYKGVTHKNFISFNKVTGEINGFNGLGSAYDLSTGGIIENAGSIYVSFSNIQESPSSTLYKITNNVSSLIEIPENLYIVKMAFDQTGKFYICGYLGVEDDDYATIYEYSENTTWTGITSSIPGFRCKGFAFDTNNVLYAVCNTSDKKCLYRKALDSNEWTALVDGEIMSDIKIEGETVLTQPNISINKYNQLYIYGDFTHINGKYKPYISRYNEGGHAFEYLSGDNFFYPYNKLFGVSAAVFDEKGDLYINGGIYVEKLIFNELMPLDINYSNNSAIQYSMLINNEELIVSYVRDGLNTDLVSHKLNGKKTVITDKELQYTTKTEQKFRYDGSITSIYRNKTVQEEIYKNEIYIGGIIGRFNNGYNDINSPLVVISEYNGYITYITANQISKYESTYIGGNKSDVSYVIGSYTKPDNLKFISDLLFGNIYIPTIYQSPDEKYISKVQFNDTNIYINATTIYSYQQIGTDSFVYELSRDTNTWTNISISIKDFHCYSICLDKNDNLYALGYTGDNTSGGSLFLKNKDDNEWVALPSGNLFFPESIESITIDLVSDNNGELYICGDFVKIGESDIAYIAKYNKTLEAFESVGDVLQSAVKNIAFDSKNNIYIAQNNIDEKNIKTLVNNVWEYVDVCDKENWSVRGVINITDDVLTASYLGFSDIIGTGTGPNDFESIVSYDLKTKKRTYPGWATKTTKQSGNVLQFNELGQSVEIFTDVNDPYTNAIIINKSEGVIFSNRLLQEETRLNQSKNVRQVKDFKSEKGLLKQLNTKSIFGRKL